MRTNLKRVLARSEQMRGASAFTMIEIALSVAVVAFALVAILGVLPTGMRVQKDNLEDTVINQDGLFLLEAIRSSTRSLDELTNYVELITISNINKRVDITNFASGEEIVGLLTTLKTPMLYSSSVPAGPRTFVNARVRSLTGGAGDKGNRSNEFAFRYQVEAETFPVQVVPPISIDNLRKYANSLTNGALEKLLVGEEIARLYNLNNYTFDVRLTLRWPVYQRGDTWQVGRSRKVFRTLITGTLSTNKISASTRNLTFVVPNTFTNYLGATPTQTNTFYLPYAL